jgi:transposase-like protein
VISPLKKEITVLACPHCKTTTKIWRKGVYVRPSDRLKIQRFFCVPCKKKFSDRRYTLDFRLRKRPLNQMIFRLLAKGNSQRGIALLLQVNPKAVARRVVRYGQIARWHLEHYRKTRDKARVILFDEMESFEHTHMKPLTMPIAVEEDSRKVLAIELGQIAAKGPLAEASRAKYGPRYCTRKKLLQRLMKSLKECCHERVIVKTDSSTHYPKRIKEALPKARHRAFLGMRGAVVGQGEMKVGTYDPLFTLNHTYAMFRDNVKRLTRRTWCTTKNPDNLRHLLYIYAYFHNEYVEGIRKIFLRGCLGPI